MSLVGCFAGSGRVDGRDFTERQDRGPPCLWGVCGDCIQGPLRADRGGSPGKGLAPRPPDAGLPALRPVPCASVLCSSEDTRSTTSLWEAWGSSNGSSFPNHHHGNHGKGGGSCAGWGISTQHQPVTPQKHGSLVRTVRLWTLQTQHKCSEARFGLFFLLRPILKRSCFEGEKNECYIMYILSEDLKLQKS